jgi:hypothetical protein
LPGGEPAVAANIYEAAAGFEIGGRHVARFGRVVLRMLDGPDNGVVAELCCALCMQVVVCDHLVGDIWR